MTHEEMISKAQKAESAQELLAIARENGLDLSPEDAQRYIDVKNQNGELPDEVLDGVSGGAAYTLRGGYLIVTNFHECDRWRCSKCGGSDFSYTQVANEQGWGIAHKCSGYPNGCGKSCQTCKYETYRFPFQICTHPDTRK